MKDDRLNCTDDKEMDIQALVGDQRNLQTIFHLLGKKTLKRKKLS